MTLYAQKDPLYAYACQATDKSVSMTSQESNCQALSLHDSLTGVNEAFALWCNGSKTDLCFHRRGSCATTTDGLQPPAESR